MHFSVIENYISTTYANQMVKGPAPSNGRRAAVIGAGPSGLTIAVILARYGYQVTIFDSKDKIGGVMRYVIPDFRLPDAVLDDFAYRHLELKGIQFRPNTAIGGAIGLDDDGRTSRPGVFAAGDVAHGARTVVEAVATGKRVAEAMHEYMQSLPMPEPSPYADAPRVEPVESSVLAEQVIPAP